MRCTRGAYCREGVYHRVCSWGSVANGSPSGEGPCGRCRLFCGFNGFARTRTVPSRRRAFASPQCGRAGEVEVSRRRAARPDGFGTPRLRIEREFYFRRPTLRRNCGSQFLRSAATDHSDDQQKRAKRHQTDTRTTSKPGAANPKPRAAPPFFPGAAPKPDATRRTHERPRCHGENPCAAGVPYSPRLSEAQRSQGQPPTEPSGPGKPNERLAGTSEGRGPAKETNDPQKQKKRDPRRTAAAHHQHAPNQAKSAATFADPRGGLREPIIIKKRPSGRC